jgi:hypothetical protein
MRGAERFRRVAAVLLSFMISVGMIPVEGIGVTALAVYPDETDSVSDQSVWDEPSGFDEAASDETPDETPDETEEGSVEEAWTLQGSGTKENPYKTE